jgi:hypothetical protein
MPLISPEPEKIEIELYYKEKKINNGGSVIIVIDDEDAEKMLQDEEKKDKVKKLKTQWKILDWQHQNRITAESRVFTPEGLQDIDPIKYRDLRIKSGLIGWDIKYNDKDVPVTPEMIDKLPPQVVFALVQKYDQATTIDEEEAKKA